MLFNIPQFIDKEDKLVGPLTAKQLGWMAGAGAILLVLYGLLEASAEFFLAAIPVVGIFGALAFYRPYNQPLIAFIYYTILFAVRPKMYVWRRLPEKLSPPKKAKGKVEVVKEKRVVNQQKISEISKLLDQR